MRIIENNYTGDRNNTEHDVVCPYCKSKLTYYDADLRDRYEGAYVVCPCCCSDIDIDGIPTIDTIQYPKDFYTYNGKSVKDYEINEWIKECLDNLDNDTDYSFMASGDTIVFAFKSDEDLPAATVVVAKKYQEADVKISRKNF